MLKKKKRRRRRRKKKKKMEEEEKSWKTNSDKIYNVHLMLLQLVTLKSVSVNSMLHLPQSMHRDNGQTAINFTMTKNKVIRSTCFPH
jgi:D-alanyl-lipoteichoic acid acyltransferase DltB (MBOAT superfamily)